MKASEAKKLADNIDVALYLKSILFDIKLSADSGWYERIVSCPPTKLRPKLVKELTKLGYTVENRDAYSIIVKWY